MTDQDWQDLGRRAVACRAWRWLPGMLEIGGARSNGEQYGGSVWVDHCGGSYEPIAGWVPDLRDPATVGCLLALVREAWKPWAGIDPMPCTHQTLDGSWGVGSWVSRTFAAINLPTYHTEAHALVAALEAAP